MRLFTIRSIGIERSDGPAILSILLHIVFAVKRTPSDVQSRMVGALNSELGSRLKYMLLYLCENIEIALQYYLRYDLNIDLSTNERKDKVDYTPQVSQI